MKQTFFILFCILILRTSCFPQVDKAIDSLSVFRDQVEIARRSNNTAFVLKTYFNNYFASISSWSSNKDDFDQAIRFIEEGIEYARSINKYDYVAIGYIQQAVILRKKGDNEKALGAATTALWDYENILSDSVKTVVYIELGDCYQARSEFVEASKYYNKAFDIALESNNHLLESKINNSLANLYYKQKDTVEAKTYLYKNVLLNQKNKNIKGLLDTYTQLARVTDNEAYIDTVFSLASSSKMENYTLEAKQILLAIYGFAEKNTRKALDYINSQPDLKNSYLKGRGGVANYQYYIGQMYLNNNRPDSALYYIKKAEPGFIKDSNIKNLQVVTRDIANCYVMLNDKTHAIDYYKKSLEYSIQLAKLPAILSVSNSLSMLYGQIESFELAYTYKLLTSKTEDTLKKLGKERDLVMMEIYRDTKKHEDELRLQEERIRRKHNLQYMGITIAICIVFLSFLVLGMFPVSKLVIRIFGFISFICLFEFVILLMEHSVLHPITHGDPLKLWLLKIVLIALLVPFQQFLEHRLIAFLHSKKLHQVRIKLMANQWWKKGKTKLKPEIIDDVNIE